MTDVIRIVRGNPTPEELAALVVVFLGRSSGGTEPAVVVSEPSRWATYWRTTQTTALPDAWRDRR
jgi:hypothetical protein